MLRLLDGFDIYSSGQVFQKYAAYSATFIQDTKVTGRDGEGEAYGIINTAFGEADFYSQFEAQGVWGFHADFQTNATVQVDFYRWRSSALGGGVQCSLRLTAARHLAIVNRAGTVVATGASTITRNQWYTLECYATFGTGGRLDVYLDGALEVSATFATTAQPDQVGFRWAAFGERLYWDNYAVYDGQPGQITAPFGRARVTTLRPIADVQLVWTPNTGGSDWPLVDDAFAIPSPDGDTTYMTPTGPGPQYFTLAASPCYGLVLGLGLNASARPAGAPFPLRFITFPLAAALTMADITPSTAAYRTYQAIAELNPATSDTWIDADISSAYWGLSTPAGGVPRVTAVNLEKLVSLEPLPYTCGGGPYSF